MDQEKINEFLEIIKENKQEVLELLKGVKGAIAQVKNDPDVTEVFTAYTDVVCEISAVIMQDPNFKKMQQEQEARLVDRIVTAIKS